MSVKNSFIIFLVLFSSAIYASGNPFLKPSSSSTSNVKQKDQIEKTDVSSLKKVSFYDTLIYRLNKIQHTLNKKVSTIGKHFKESFSLLLLIKLFLIGFLYGLIHALGPGHGKIFVTTYFSAKKSKFRYGLFMGVFIAVFHVFSAVFLVSFFYFVLKDSILINMNNNERIIKKISYSVIMVIGLFMFIKQFFHKDDNHNKPAAENTLKDSLIFALTVGIIPCPGTAMLMVFFISLNCYWLGLLISSSMAVGMAVTIALTGMGVIAIKNKTLDSSSKINIIGKAISFISPLFIVAISLVLLLGDI